MGESVADFRAQFDGAVRIEARSERLTGDAGALLLRDGLERIGFVDWLAGELVDRRTPELIVHPLIELVLTSVLLLAQGWRDQDDADALRDDPVLRLAVSTRRGTAPLLPAPRDDRGCPTVVPDGLASQPTLSRLARDLAEGGNRATLRRALVKQAAHRIRSMRPGAHRRISRREASRGP